MAAAIALAIVLVIAVGGVSLAMQSQRTVSPQPRPRAAPRPTPVSRMRPRRAPTPPKPAAEPVVEAAVAPERPLPTPKGPALLRTGVAAEARVVNVVDERVVGAVTRSRLTLVIEPDGGDPIEVSLRHAFPTLEARSKVRIGGKVPVRYDRDSPKKVVIDTNA